MHINAWLNYETVLHTSRMMCYYFNIYNSVMPRRIEVARGVNTGEPKSDHKNLIVHANPTAQIIPITCPQVGEEHSVHVYNNVCRHKILGKTIPCCLKGQATLADMWSPVAHYNKVLISLLVKHTRHENTREQQMK